MFVLTPSWNDVEFGGGVFLSECILSLVKSFCCMSLSGGGSVGPCFGEASVYGDRPCTRPFGSRGGVDPQLNLRRIPVKYRSIVVDGRCPSPRWLKRLSKQSRHSSAVAFP